MNFSNQTHPPIEIINTAPARQWLHDSYQRHLAADGSIDAEALAEALAWDTALDKMTAEDLTAEFVREMDGE